MNNNQTSYTRRIIAMILTLGLFLDEFLHSIVSVPRAVINESKKKVRKLESVGTPRQTWGRFHKAI